MVILLAAASFPYLLLAFSFLCLYAVPKYRRYSPTKQTMQLLLLFPTLTTRSEKYILLAADSVTLCAERIDMKLSFDRDDKPDTHVGCQIAVSLLTNPLLFVSFPLIEKGSFIL